MKYDADDIARRVEARKKKFLGWTALFICVAIASVIGAALVPDGKFLIVAVLICAILAVAEAGLFRKYKPSIIFSSELEGENVKEYEYYAGVVGTPIRRRVNLPHNYSNAKPTPRSKIQGIIYLRLENGDIRQIGGLNTTLMDIYEEGDILNKPAGARYPQIISRSPELQPCPLCGELNSDGGDACRGCGLLIVKTRR